MTTTIRPVPRPRGDLTPDQMRRLERLRAKRDAADAEYRAGVVEVLNEGASFTRVKEATGHSTRTLQDWKREAQ